MKNKKNRATRKGRKLSKRSQTIAPDLLNFSLEATGKVLVEGSSNYIESSETVSDVINAIASTAEVIVDSASNVIEGAIDVGGSVIGGIGELVGEVIGDIDL